MEAHLPALRGLGRTTAPEVTAEAPAPKQHRRLTPPPGAARFLCSRSQLLKSVQARHGFLDGSSAPEPAAPCGAVKGKEKGPLSVPGNGEAPRPGRPSLGAAILAPRCTPGRGGRGGRRRLNRPVPSGGAGGPVTARAGGTRWTGLLRVWVRRLVPRVRR